MVMEEFIKDLFTIDAETSLDKNMYSGTMSSSNTLAVSTTAGTNGSATWTVYPYPYTSDGTTTPITGGWSGGTITIPSTGGWTTGVRWPPSDQDFWPKVEDGIGVVFVDGDLIKLKTKNGKEVVIGKLNPDDETEVIPLEVIIAKKKLLEGTKEADGA